MDNKPAPCKNIFTGVSIGLMMSDRRRLARKIRRKRCAACFLLDSVATHIHVASQYFLCTYIDLDELILINETKDDSNGSTKVTATAQQR